MNGLDKTTRRRRAQFLGTTALSPPARLLAAPVLGVALLIAAPAAASPTGYSVVEGTATIDDVANGAGGIDTTITQTTDRAVINWNDFSLTTFDNTTFNQLGADSIALNRVTGAAQSSIFGNLTANGRVWLINPNGVVMHGSSTIDTAGFLATTADITDADFLNDDVFNFNTASGITGAVVTNAGSITVADTGLVALMAPGVENSGTITANLGTVKLGGVETFTLDLTGGLVAFSMETAVATAIAGVFHQVSSTGSIFADGGTVTLSARAVNAAISAGAGVNMTGVIQARSVGTDNNGSVVLSADADSVSVNGAIDATGLGVDETGGTIDVDGTIVTFGVSTVADVAGTLGGGTIDATAATGGLIINGDLLASDGRVTLTAAQQVAQSSAGSDIVADTLEISGGAPTISIFQSMGSMTATGATTLTGTGMVALISATNALSGPIDMTAGNLIQFTNGAGVATTTFGNVSTGAGTGLTVSLLGGGLAQEAGTSITAGTFALLANGDVTLMEAGNDINALSAVNNAGGSFAYRDADTFNMLGAITATDVTLASGGLLSVTKNVTATAGNVALSGDGVTFSGTTTVDSGAGTLAVDGGTATIATATGSLLLSTGTVDLSADEIDLAAGSQTGGSALATGEAATVILRAGSAGQAVEVAGGGVTGNLDLTVAELDTVRATNLRLGDPTGGSLTVANAWTPTATTVSGVLTLASGGNISQSAGATLDLSVSTADLILRAGNGVTLNEVLNDFNKVASVSTAGSINLTDANTITISVLTDDLGTVSGLIAPGGYTLTAAPVIWDVPKSPQPGRAPIDLPPPAEEAASRVCDTDAGSGARGAGGTAACGADTGGASDQQLLSSEDLQISGLN